MQFISSPTLQSHHHETAKQKKGDVSHERENKLAQNETQKLHECEENQ